MTKQRKYQDNDDREAAQSMELDSKQATPSNMQQPPLFFSPSSSTKVLMSVSEVVFLCSSVPVVDFCLGLSLFLLRTRKVSVSLSAIMPNEPLLGQHLHFAPAIDCLRPDMDRARRIQLEKSPFFSQC